MGAADLMHCVAAFWWAGASRSQLQVLLWMLPQCSEVSPCFCSALIMGFCTQALSSRGRGWVAAQRCAVGASERLVSGASKSCVCRRWTESCSAGVDPGTFCSDYFLLAGSCSAMMRPGWRETLPYFHGYKPSRVISCCVWEQTGRCHWVSLQDKLLGVWKGDGAGGEGEREGKQVMVVWGELIRNRWEQSAVAGVLACWASTVWYDDSGWCAAVLLFGMCFPQAYACWGILWKSVVCSLAEVLLVLLHARDVKQAAAVLMEISWWFHLNVTHLLEELRYVWLSLS